MTKEESLKFLDNLINDLEQMTVDEYNAFLLDKLNNDALYNFGTTNEIAELEPDSTMEFVIC